MTKEIYMGMTSEIGEWSVETGNKSHSLKTSKMQKAELHVKAQSMESLLLKDVDVLFKIHTFSWT